jgi:hypothetical protein
MTLAGWITMFVSLVFVWALTFWCFARVVRSPQKERVPPGFGP